MKNKKIRVRRHVAIFLCLVMLLNLLPMSAMAAEVTTGAASDIKTATAGVYFGGSKAYDVTAEASVNNGKIENVVFSHNAEEQGHSNSVSFADKAKAMADKFKGISVTDKNAIDQVDVVSGATITSRAYRVALLEALGFRLGDYTFGSANTELKAGEYVVPVALMKADQHVKPSNAATAFPTMATLIVAQDGTATLKSAIQPVTVGPITDMAYDIKYYKENDYLKLGTAYNVDVLQTMVKPDSMPEPGKDVPTEISFIIPNNDFDGVYLNFTVDAMGPAYPDAWLKIDYANAKVPGNVETKTGSAKVDQFGKYTIDAKVTLRDGVITGVDLSARDWISTEHKATNDIKVAQIKEALKNTWNGMAPTQENAEKIFKAIMSKTNPDAVIDTVSGASYSARAARDAVMNAFGLEYQDEIINVPENVDPGVYDVKIGYYSDVVWHSLVEEVRTNAKLTVNNDKTMVLDFETKSGTSKEPLYILGFDGIYPNNDTSQPLTTEGCSTVKGLSSNDYSDENFAKGTQVVNHMTIPLEGGLHKIYKTSHYLYVPAMKRLNGETSGILFENGKFHVNCNAKIYWDTMNKIGDVEPEKPQVSQDQIGTVDVTMKHESKDQNSMCDIMFNRQADVSVKDNMATLKLYVANPVPGFPDQGADGTVKNFVVQYKGVGYPAKSELNTGAKMTAKQSNPVFGFEQGKQYAAQVLSVTLPKEALNEDMLTVNTFVNVVMNTDVVFRMDLMNLKLEDVKPEIENNTAGTVDTEMKHESKDQNSMCDIMFNRQADVSVKDNMATLKLYVANPVPGFPDQGADGTVKNFVVQYKGVGYPAKSELNTGAKMTAKQSNPVFGFEQGKQYAAQVLSVTLPKEALNEDMLTVNTFVNVVMNTDVGFRIKLSNLDLKQVTEPEPDPDPTPGPGPGPAPIIPSPEPEVPEVPEVTPEDKVFTDISDNHWAKNDINEAVNRGIFGGVSETEFAPEGTMTRAMFVTVLGRIAGIDAGTYKDADFNDVKAGEWYAPYVAWGVENGIVKGMSETEFAPNEMVRRQDMAVFLERFCKYENITLADKGDKNFADESKIDSYAKDAVEIITNAGLIKGMGDDIFSPKTSATRAQVAALLVRFVKEYSL